MSRPHTHTCVVGERGKDLVIGDSLIVPDDDSIIVRGVTLDDAMDLDWDESWVVPAARSGIEAGAFRDFWHPHWGRRVPADGAVLAPGTSWDVLVRVHRTSIRYNGKAAALRIDYQRDGFAFDSVGSTSFIVAQVCDDIDFEGAFDDE